MIFLLPPSETKRSGGAPGSMLDFDALSFPSLTPSRRVVAAAVVRLSRDVDASMQALGIGPRLRDEVDRNRALRRSETLPALKRYTGVAFDPIEADALSEQEWDWASRYVAVHSALFGVVGAADPLPAYRLSHNSRLPGLMLKRHWSGPIAGALEQVGEPLIDLRSDGYVALGPAPAGSALIRVVSDEGGRRRALNHFNKKAKGTLIKRLLEARPELVGIDDFVEWARSAGIVLEPVAGELHLVSESVLRE